MAAKICSFSSHFLISLHFFFLKKLFLERGEGREKRGSKASISCLSHAPNWGPGPATQSCALTWNGMGGLLAWLVGQRPTY